MIGDSQVCGACHLEACVVASLCDGVIKLLCVKCSRDHFIDTTKDHILVELDLALRMQADSSLVESYLAEQAKILKPLQSLKKLSDKAKRVKRYYKSCKSKLIAHIEEIFDQPIGEIEDILQDYSEKIKTLNSYKTSWCDEGKCLVENYKGYGANSIVINTIEKVSIPLDEILEYLTQTVFRQIVDSRDSYSLSEKDRVFDSLRREIEDKHQKYNTLNDAYKHQIFQNAEYTTQISRLHAKVEELESKVMIRDNQIQTLNSQLEYYLNTSSEGINNLKLELQNCAIHINEKNIKNSCLIPTHQSLNPHISKLTESLSESEENMQELDLSSQGSEQELNAESTMLGKTGRYIYTPITSRKSLMQYDVVSGKVKMINIPTLSRNFSTTSSCELPNGDVFLAGFHDQSFEAYLFKIATQEIITLQRLLFPRSSITLFYYRDYVYAFGGKNFNRPERYSLCNNAWETLHRMKYNRESLSCIGINDKIYLFCGGHTNIEIFDTITLQFAEIEINNSDIYSSECAVAYRVEDRVYLLTDNLLQIYDTTLPNLPKLANYNNTYKCRHFSLNNIIYYKNSIYYYNYHTLTIEKIDITLPLLPPPIYSHNPNRYIYRTRDNSKEIYSIDLEHSTIQTFNLSTALNRNFIGTSLCVINTGEVIVAGFKSPLSDKCYLFSPRLNSCNRIGDLNTSRYFTTLIYHEGSVYAFGGRGSNQIMTNKAEKIDVISKNSWTILPDMIKRRSVPSCIGVNNKIYIMGGSDSSIEIFNINTKSYQLSQIQLRGNYGVSGMIDDQIHIIGDKSYMILTDKLERISEFNDRYEEDYFTCTMGNIVCYKGKIYFYNQGRRLLEKVDPVDFKREVQIIAHSTT